MLVWCIALSRHLCWHSNKQVESIAVRSHYSNFDHYHLLTNILSVRPKMFAVTLVNGF